MQHEIENQGAKKYLWRKMKEGSLVKQIAIGLVLGIALALLWPEGARNVTLLGELFVSALKAVAPVLVFMLVMSAIANHKKGQKTTIRPIIILYLIGTFASAVVAVIASFLFPSTLVLAVNESTIVPPSNIFEVFRGILTSIVASPIDAILKGNYISILAWSIGLGVVLRHASGHTKIVIQDFSEGITQLVRGVIRLAPIGIFGLVASTLESTGFSVLEGYLHVLMVLLGSMIFIALVMNPLIVFLTIRRNPYPLVLTCLRESGITAFFTRSSAANIPINMALCRKLNLHEDTYSISIPLGATINMGGAAVTITILTLAAVHSLPNMPPVDIATALLLSLVASISACGASGVAGGSLLLIPLACNMFGIPNEIAMQVVAVGLIIGVLQDSAETGLNSSTDVLFTAAACRAKWKRSSSKQ